MLYRGENTWAEGVTDNQVKALRVHGHFRLSLFRKVNYMIGADKKFPCVLINIAYQHSLMSIAYSIPVHDVLNI